MHNIIANAFQCCLLPQTKLREGNVFTPVCQSFCSQERDGVSAWCHFLSGCLVPCSFWRGRGSFVLGICVWGGGLCPGGSLSRGVSGGLCQGDLPRRNMVPDREQIENPWTKTPWQKPPWTEPPPPFYGKAETVRILLECILVVQIEVFHPSIWECMLYLRDYVHCDVTLRICCRRRFYQMTNRSRKITAKTESDSSSTNTASSPELLAVNKLSQERMRDFL